MTLLVSPDNARVIWSVPVYANQAEPPGLMIRDVGDDEPTRLPMEKLGLWSAHGAHFIATQAASGEGEIDLHIRSFNAPKEPRLRVRGPLKHPDIWGDRDLLKLLPPILQGGGPPNWLWRHTGDGVLEAADTSWFGPHSYDIGYQAPGHPLLHPASNKVLLGVQRSGHFVVLDPTTGEKQGVIELAGRGGNPRPTLGASGRIWTIDYDTLVRVEADLSVSGQAEVQPGGLRNGHPIRQFAGELCLSPDERHVFVARPFSGDVAIYDATTLAHVDTLETGGEPWHIAVMPDGLVTLDWKTGQFRLTPLS